MEDVKKGEDNRMCSGTCDRTYRQCSHPDETGKFNQKTYQSMVDLCAWLCLKFDLNENDVLAESDSFS